MKAQYFGQLLIVLTLSLSAHARVLKDALNFSLDHLDAESCVVNLSELAKKLDSLSVDDYKTELAHSKHESLLKSLWNYKMGVHKTIRTIYREEGLFKDCADAARLAFLKVRTVEDLISEDQLRKNSELKFPDHAFDLDNQHVRRHPQFKKFNMRSDLKSGDIILSRGNAYTSAAISSLGEFDTQFSHLSVVYKDPDGKIWTVESHIEVGVFVRTLQEHIDDKNSRTVLYRFDDEEVAAKAAEYIFHKAKKASETTGNIFYDFGFDMSESNSLFCSEVASYAFSKVTSGGVELPIFKSKIMTRKPEFVEMLGIKVQESFIPADLEVDPRFTMISEWRDANKIRDNLEKDAVLQAMYSWNDEFGYRMKQASSSKSLMYRNIAWPLRRTPYFKKFVEKKLPINMSRRLIGYFGVLESVGELLQKELKKEENKTLEERGFPLLPSEKREFLDSFRMTESKSQKKLHKMYRPLKK